MTTRVRPRFKDQRCAMRWIDKEREYERQSRRDDGINSDMGEDAARSKGENRREEKDESNIG